MKTTMAVYPLLAAMTIHQLVDMVAYLQSLGR